MTAIATFTLGETSFLLADTLVTHEKAPARKGGIDAWLSTGVLVAADNQKVHEELLKIWLVQPNLVLAYAGVVRTATEALRLVAEQSRKRPFSVAEELLHFIRDRVVPSVGPFTNENAVVFCGFFTQINRHVKYRCSLGPHNPLCCRDKLREGFDLYRRIWRRYSLKKD